MLYVLINPFIIRDYTKIVGVQILTECLRFFNALSENGDYCH